MKVTCIVFFLLAACMILPVSVAAQQSKLELGVDAGLGGSYLFGGSVNDQYVDPMLCYTTGLFVNYNFNKFIAIKTGVYNDLKGYSNKLVVSNYDGSQVPIKFTTSFQYLTIPLLAKFSFGSKTRFFANAGPYASYLLTSKFRDDKNLFPYPDENQATHYNRVEAGLIVGIGVSRILKEKFVLSLELRDNMGLTDINKSNPYLAKTNSLNFVLGFAWRFGKKKVEK